MIDFKINQASLTFLQSIPTVSQLSDCGITPVRLTSPYVGFNPTIPLYAAGRKTDPTV